MTEAVDAALEAQLPRSYKAWRAWAEEHDGGDGYYVQGGFEIGYEIGRAERDAEIARLVAAARGAAILLESIERSTRWPVFGADMVVEGINHSAKSALRALAPFTEKPEVVGR